MLIPKNIFPIAKLCDTESTRYALGGVRLEREGENNTPVAVATDGRRLIAARWDETPGEEYHAEGVDLTHMPDFETIVPAKEWNEAAKLAPRKTLKPEYQNTVLEESTANGRVRMVGMDYCDTVRAIEPKTLEGRFPKWQEVFPQYREDETASITVDPTYLAEVLAVIQKMTHDETHRGVELIVPLDPSRPVLVQGKGNGTEATGVVMPLARD